MKSTLLSMLLVAAVLGGLYYWQRLHLPVIRTSPPSINIPQAAPRDEKPKQQLWVLTYQYISKDRTDTQMRELVVKCDYLNMDTLLEGRAHLISKMGPPWDTNSLILVNALRLEQP